MADRAEVASIEALEYLRTSFIIYLDKASAALDEVSEEVKRTRQWLEYDQRSYWTSQHRNRSRKLDQAQQEFFSARLSDVPGVEAAKKAEVRKAKRLVEETEARLRILKKWIENFDNFVGPRHKKLESLRFVFKHDMAKGVAFLTEALKALEGYAELTGSSGGGGGSGASSRPADPADDEPGEEGTTAGEGENAS